MANHLDTRALHHSKNYKVNPLKKDRETQLGKIQVEIKTSFGKIIVEGSSVNDLMGTLETLPENFTDDLEEIISKITKYDKEKGFNEIVRQTENGPILILKDKGTVTHCEAIGLILYFSKSRSNRSSQIRRLLEYSGIKIQVSSRLNEMVKRGFVFKLNIGSPDWTLSPKGEKWIEEEVLPRLRNNQ
ncbi:MAG: hypothetical protein QXR06_03605 [Candidatus Bathyarchaeia archaeon]|nr:hypothetical protein [Candidatus Bathyarchaeota archaeon]